jgi:hypothetical protein
MTNPVDDDRSFWTGEIVFDRKRTDILSDPLVVVDPEPRTLEHIKHRDKETYKAVKYNDTNLDLMGKTVRSEGLPLATPCITVSYLDSDSNKPTVEGRTYTFPTFRLMRVTGDEKSSLPAFRPTMLAAAELIHQLEDAAEDGGINSVDDLHVALMEADVDGEIIAAASRLADGDDW